MTVAFAFANVYCGCSRLYSLLDVFVYICSCFIQTWVEQCVSVADNNDTTEHPHLDTTRPYLCTMCRKRYRSRQNLNMRSKTHTGEDMFSCSQCEKRFSSQSGLYHHMNIHTGSQNVADVVTLVIT